ncbi:rhomboid protease GluP [Marchantia polymorpha subsp. ruderalis]
MPFLSEEEMIAPGNMGALGSNDAVNLLFTWMMGSRSLNCRKSDAVGGWHAVTASRCGLGLFGSGAHLQLRNFLSKSLNHSRSLHSPEQPWKHSPSRIGARGLPYQMSLGILSSNLWSSWYMGPQGQNLSDNRSQIRLAAFGGVSADGSPSPTDDKSQFPRRNLTNFLLGLNILVFIAQAATQGKLLLAGAKVNSLIDKGQFWRLLTPAVLHANVFHLLVNSYSLNSVGPSVEAIAGPKRFVAVYTISALTSTTLSYCLCKSPSVGASGAIFGLVGALAVFLLRHKNMMVGGQRSFKQVGRIIVLNMVLGLSSAGIDNWSHFGGLLGGAAVTWLLGPVYSFETPPGGGKRQLVDRPPISYLISARSTSNR